MEIVLTAEAIASLAAALKPMSKGTSEISRMVKITIADDGQPGPGVVADLTDGYRALRLPLLAARGQFPNMAAVVEGAVKTATWYMEADRAALVAALKAAALIDKASAAMVFDPAGEYKSLTIAGLPVAATSAAGKADTRREWRINPVYMLEALAPYAPRKGEADRPIRIYADPVYPELPANQASSMSALRITAAPDTERLGDPLHTLLMPIRF